MADAATQETPPEIPTGLQSDTAQPDSITWTASEFIAHEKSAGWYTMLALATAIIAGIVYLITRDYISVGVVVVAGIILGAYAAHEPRQLEYEGAFSSITFMPLKRFSPPISIYYAPEDEDRIVTLLSDKLPIEQRRLDAVDNLMRKIRF
jgi:hypothetical protein